MTVEEIKENAKIMYNIMQGRPNIKIRLNDLETDCLLDTGARVNVIDSKIQSILFLCGRCVPWRFAQKKLIKKDTDLWVKLWIRSSYLKNRIKLK